MLLKKQKPWPVFVHSSIFVIAHWIILSIYLSTQYGRGVTGCQKDLLNMLAWCWCSPPSCRDHTDVTDSTFQYSTAQYVPNSPTPSKAHRIMYLDSLLSLGQLTILAWSTKLSRRKWKKIGLTSGNARPLTRARETPRGPTGAQESRRGWLVEFIH